MKGLVSKIHIFIFLYLAFGVFTKWQEHSEKLSQMEMQIPAVTAKINKSKREKKQITAYLKDVEAAKERIELVAQEVEKIQRKLPDVVDDTKNLSLLKNLAEKLNIRSIYLTPLDEITKGFYIAKRYSLKASGTFLQFLMLMEQIGSTQTILNVKRISLENQQEKQRGRFQIIDADIIIETYRYNSNYKESRGIEDIEKNLAEQAKPKRGKKKSRIKKK
ncbi:putative pilus assembly protein [Halobacteriovorax marinus SJ]|uniref:Pilus assembly protein n=1 Tax=Halobacteriovorax marinus (strain ATCC BAA-682 / DSM 15412 / SJ) TaxID=862908 RepID=E1X2B1_HALMS|nr:type 4a pilus biogenesis protein PilO [Halobacteriovorax marinus]CBW25067.1 putative pilus assembly protein [Halobacteriovorax marinus SJ]